MKRRSFCTDVLPIIAFIISVVFLFQQNIALGTNNTSPSDEISTGAEGALQQNVSEDKQKNVKTAKSIIVARVNGTDISMYTLIRAMNRLTSKYVREDQEITPEITERIKKEALDKVIYEELAVQEAIRQGVAPKEESVNKVLANVRKTYGSEEGYQNYLKQFDFTEESFRERVVRGQRLELITAREIYRKVKVSDAAMKKLYKKEKKAGRLKKAEEYVVKDILIIEGDKNKDPEARAKTLLQEIKKYDNDFGKLVFDGTFITRRLPVKKELFPAIYQAMKRLDEGELSKVVKERDGYHIFKVAKKEKKRDLTLEEAKGFLENTLRVEAQELRKKEWANSLRAKAKIEYFDQGKGAAGPSPHAKL